MSGVAWKNRVKSLTMESPEDLLANPANARRHPGPQRDAIRGSLEELGWAAPVIVNDVTNHLLDGHLRVEEAISEGTPVIPVVHVELSIAEERLFLGVYDPIGAMANNDQDALDELLASIDTENKALLEVLASLSGDDIDSGAIHGAPKKRQTLVLIYEPDDYTELCGALSLLPGYGPADKILRLVRNAL